MLSDNSQIFCALPNAMSSLLYRAANDTVVKGTTNSK